MIIFRHIRHGDVTDGKIMRTFICFGVDFTNIAQLYHVKRLRSDSLAEYVMKTEKLQSPFYAAA